MNTRNKFIVVISLTILLFNVSEKNINAQQSNITSPFKQGTTTTTPKTNPPISGQVEKQIINTPKNEKATTNEILNPNNPLGLTAAENEIKKAADLAQKNKLYEARNLMEATIEWLEEATEYHTDLYKILVEIDNAKAQADLERGLALQYAILRDKALYQSALVYIQEKNLKKAAEKLVDVVRSQPKTELGFNAYSKLQEIGFTRKIQLIKSETSIENQE